MRRFAFFLLFFVIGLIAVNCAISSSREVASSARGYELESKNYEIESESYSG